MLILEKWEGEIAKYEKKCTKQFDENLKLAILSEVALKALAPQIAMNSYEFTKPYVLQIHEWVHRALFEI